ncbi:MAG: DUF4349 domain-containing protein [Deltaproteobacteria bacterium]|nr:DUF4349 domain-containing protein [Deltaproteobacteria bacterium]
MDQTPFSALRRVLPGRWLAWVAVLSVLGACLGCHAGKHAQTAGAAYAPSAQVPREEASGEDSVALGAPSPAMAPPPPAPAAMDKSASREVDYDAKKDIPAPPPAEQTPKPPTPPRVAADAAPLSQMLIYAAQLTMAVFEVDKCLARVETVAREMGGLLATRTDRQIVIRVPTAKFFEAVKQLEALGDVLHKSVQVEDVSEEFRDLSLRLKNAKEVRDRLVVLLAAAKTVEESIKVEREIERLSAEIQRMEGRLKYLKDRAAYSTITITFEALQAEILQRQKVFKLPFPWLSEMGLGRLLNLN